MAITYEHVAQAAETLTSKGEPLSLRALRLHLGSGSLGTIQKHLAAWRENRPLLPKNREALYPDIQALIRQEIDKAVTQTRNDLTGDLSLARKELGEIVADNETKEETILRLEEKTRGLEETTQHQAGQISQLEATLAQVREREITERKNREECLQALAKSEVRLEESDRIKEELKKIRKDLEAEKDLRIKAEKSAAVSEALLKSRA